MPIAAIIAALEAIPSAVSGIQALINTVTALGAAAQQSPPADATPEQIAALNAAVATGQQLNQQLAALLA